jgi:hypothetical protein
MDPLFLAVLESSAVFPDLVYGAAGGMWPENAGGCIIARLAVEWAFIIGGL